MKKTLVALSIAALSGAAAAQTNVTIYGTVDVSGQGFNQSNVKNGTAAGNGYNGGNTFNVQSNSSYIGFKGTEDLGNGVKALFQAETALNIAGQNATSSKSDGGGTANLGGVAVASGNSVFSSLRDSYIGVDSKYGAVQLGYLSTPFRASVMEFDVMPGATGSSDISKQMGSIRLGAASAGDQFSSAVRSSGLMYSMPTYYGVNGSIMYSGSNNNGTTNQTNLAGCTNDTSACTATPQSVFGFNLGWTGYGVNVKGAFQQASNNFTDVADMSKDNYGNYTSYLVGTTYTGVPGLKLSTTYIRNTLGTRGAVSFGPGNTVTTGAGKLTNNQLYAGASYRMGNWEPAVSASWSSDVNGSQYQQLGSRQWTARVGYYLSKRTQVYSLVSNLNNSTNQTYTFGQQTSNLGTQAGTSGSNLFTYGAGLRTSF